MVLLKRLYIKYYNYLNKISLNAFRDVPIPSWNINYKGLMKMKWFKDTFRSFSLSHSYDSRYSILSFSNNLEYNLQDPYAETDIVGNYFNKTLFTNVDLIEEFSPLLKVDMKMKNSISFTGRVDKDRRLTLNFNNRTDAEAKAIVHFLQEKSFAYNSIFSLDYKGNRLLSSDVASFNFKYSYPYKDDLKYTCTEFDHSIVYRNKNNIIYS